MKDATTKCLAEQLIQYSTSYLVQTPTYSVKLAVTCETSKMWTNNDGGAKVSVVIICPEKTQFKVHL